MDAPGDVYVADQLSYVVQKFTAAGAFETEWGSYGGGHGQFGPIGGLATDAAGNVYVVDSSHDRIEKFGPDGEFITAWGGRGSELGEFDFGSSQNPSQPPGGGIAVAGNHVYVADSGNNRIERFNLEGGGTDAVGHPRKRPRPVLLPARGRRQRKRGDRLRRRQPPRREIQPRRRLRSRSRLAGQRARTSSASPTAWRSTPPATCTWPTTATTASSSSRRSSRSPGRGAAPAPNPASSRSRARSPADPAGRHLRGGHRQRPHRGVRPGRRLPAHDRRPRARPRRADRAARPGHRPHRRDCSCPTRSATASRRSRRAATRSPDSGRAAGVLGAGFTPATGFASPAGIAVDPHGSVYVADAGNARVVHLWGEGTFLGELGGPADIGGAQSGGRGCARGGRPVRADLRGRHRPQPRARVQRRRQRCWRSGAPAKATAPPAAARAHSTHPQGLAVAPSGNVYVADTGNDRVVELSPGGAFIAAWGSKGTADGRFDSPTGIAVDAAGDVYVVDSENNRVEEFELERALPGQVGPARDRAGRILPAQGDRGGLRRRRVRGRHQQQSRGALRPRLPGGHGLSGARRLATTAGRRSGAAGEPPANRRRAGPARARPGRELPAGLQDPGHRDALPARPLRAVPLIAAARGLPPAVAGHVRLLVGPPALRRLREELGRHRAMTAQRDDHRRRRHRPANDGHPELHREPLSLEAAETGSAPIMTA